MDGELARQLKVVCEAEQNLHAQMIHDDVSEVSLSGEYDGLVISRDDKGMRIVRERRNDAGGTTSRDTGNARALQGIDITTKQLTPVASCQTGG